MNEETTEQETQQKENKIEKKFSNAIHKLVAIVGGKEKLKIPSKTPNDQLTELVADLFKEEREKKLEETKEKLRSLLKQFAEMEKAIKSKKDELEKLEKQKKEEFVKAAESLFNDIEDVGEREKQYYDGLKIATE